MRGDSAVDTAAKPTSSAWRAVGFSVFAVLAVSGALLFWYQQRRAAELRHQYQTMAAHEARRIELRYRSYRRVVDNVTHVPSGDAVDAAKALVEQATADERKKQTSAVLAGAQQRLERVKQQGKDLDELVEATSAQKDVEAKARDALEQCHRRAFAASAAQQIALKSAAGAERACRASESVPIDQARQCGAEQKTAREKQRTADAKRDAAYGPCDQAAKDVRGASQPALAESIASALGNLRNSTQAAAVAVKADQALDDDAALLLGLVADERIASLARLQVLPDEVETLAQRCLRPKDASASMTVCIAQEIARMTSVAGGLDVTQCPSGIADREPLLLKGDDLSIPPHEPNELAACGHLKYAAMFPEQRLQPTDGDEASTGFDAALILRSDGEALSAVQTSSNVRVLSLPRFDPKTATSTAMIENVVIGSETYRAFLQPVAIPVTSADGATKHLFFCGLVRQDALRLDSLRVSPPVSLLIAMLLAATLLCLPLAKLWLTGRKKAFTRLDVTTLAVSALATSLLATVFCCAYAASARLSHRLDRQLAHTSSQTAARFHEHIADATDTFLAEEKRTEPVEKAIAGKSPMQAACAAPAKSARFDASPIPVCEETKAPRKEPGLYFLTNADGFQLFKSTTSAHASNPIDVAERSYFLRATQGDTDCLRRDAAGACAFEGVPEIVHSATTSALVLVVARPFSGGVAALEVPLDEYSEKTVLPLGFDSFVVDSRGVIMVDANQSAQPGQSIFEELDSSAELQALLGARVSGDVDARHLGADSRLHLEPIPDSDWTVVTIAPKSLVYVPVIDAVVVTVVAYTGVLLVSFAAIVVLAILRKRRGLPVTIRPNADDASDYRRAARWLIACAVVSCALGILPVGSTASKLVAILVASIAALCIVPGIGLKRPGAVDSSFTRWLLFWRKRAPESVAPVTQERTPAKLTTSYVACCIGLASVLVMAPATVLFCGAHDQLFENLVRAEQDHYARALRHRPECWSTVQSQATPGCEDVYGSGEEGPVVGELDASPILCPNGYTPLGWLVDRLPALGFASRANARLYRVGGSHAPWTWTRSWKLLEMRSRAPRVRSRMLVDGEAMRDLVGPIAAASALFAFFLAIASLISQHSLRRLLLLDVLATKQSRKLNESNALEACVNATRGIVSFAPDGFVKSLEGRGFRDLFAEADAAGGQSFYANVDARLDDAEAAKRIASVPKTAKVVIVSAADPMRRLPDATRRAWLAALCDFSAIEVPDHESPFPAEGDYPARMAHEWSECDDDERRILSQLAEHAFANPHPDNWPTVRHLRARGLLDPSTLEIADDRFEEYVRSQTTSDDRRGWDEGDSGALWSSIRAPLSTAVVLLLGFVGVSRPELAAVGPVAPALAAGLPGLIKLLTSLVEGKRA